MLIPMMTIIFLRRAGFTPKASSSTAPGEMATGFLIFQFPELPPDALSKAASKFSLTYHDILERPYVLRIESDQINSHVPIFPGVIELGS